MSRASPWRHKQVTRSCLNAYGSTPVTMPSPPKHAPTALYNVLYDQMTEGEKTMGSFTVGSAYYVGSTKKWTGGSIIACFWDNTERHWWRKIFPAGRSLASTHDHPFCLEGYMARCAIVHWFMSIDVWLDKNLNTAWLENWWELYLGKKCVNRSLQISEGCEDICGPHKCSSKGDVNRGGV